MADNIEEAARRYWPVIIFTWIAAASLYKVSSDYNLELMSLRSDIRELQVRIMTCQMTK